MMNPTDAQNTAFIQQMNRIYPPKRKVLVIEWPDQRTVFQKHKGKIIGGTAAGIAGAVALPVALPLLGFTASGVAAGSIAASVQSVVYGAWTGGLFSLAQSAGAAGVATATTAGMAAGGAVAGLAVGSFADNSSARQKAFVEKMKNEENKIHIYSDKIYIGLKRLPGTPDMRKSFLQSLSCRSECEKSVIILGARQFTIYDTYYVEENINITDGYLWFTQYDNHKEISLKDFRVFMSKLGSSGSFNFNDVVKFVGISFDDIPQFSYVIDGDDKCHITQWTPRLQNGMFPILLPNIGFKQYAEIKPNLDKWLTSIRADAKSIQAIHKSRNNFEDVKKDYFFKETYTVLDHHSAESVSPSGVLSITPNEDVHRKRWHDSSQTMNLLNMNIKVLIYSSSD